MLGHSFLAAALAGTACAEIIWDGRFNDYTSSSDLDKWSWSNQVGEYQYYIHGTGDVTDYVNLSSDFKNPADTGSKQGAKITIDKTSTWNGDAMLRTELIPQTSAAINKGKVWYHFSMKRSDTNAPSINMEHQVAFFESHFTEMKYGWISGEANDSNSNLQWMVGGSSQWAVEFEPDVWHNIAYEIDFDASSVSFYHSTGADELTLTAGPVDASTSSNGADWHLGVLRLARDGYEAVAEDWFFSGVYVESGSLTTAVSNGGSSDSGSSSGSSAAASSAAPATSAAAAPATSSAAAAPATSAAPAASSAAAAPVASSAAAAPAVSSAAAVPVASSSVQAVEASSTPAAAVSSPAAAVPTTLATVVRSSSSAAAAVTPSPVSSAAAPEQTEDEGDYDDCE